MKIRLIILLAVGVIGVIAIPVPKQTIASDNVTAAASESVESQTKHEESTLNNVKQKKVETIDITEPDRSNDKDPNCDEKIDIVIEESVENEVDDLPNILEQEEQGPSPSDDLSSSLIPAGFEDDFPLPSPFTDTDVPLRDAEDIPLQDAPVSTIQDEIMETAAGFIPTPLVFKRKNKPRRRFPNRRFFRPNPFRRKFHFYPYYGYGFYRPSSLRFF